VVENWKNVVDGMLKCFVVALRKAADGLPAQEWERGVAPMQQDICADK